MCKKWTILKNDGCQREVEDDWLDAIPREGITGLFYAPTNNGGELKVTYENGNEVWYENIHGTWGSPKVFN